MSLTAETLHTIVKLGRGERVPESTQAAALVSGAFDWGASASASSSASSARRSRSSGTGRKRNRSAPPLPLIGPCPLIARACAYRTVQTFVESARSNLHEQGTNSAGVQKYSLHKARHLDGCLKSPVCGGKGPKIIYMLHTMFFDQFETLMSTSTFLIITETKHLLLNHLI